MPTTRTALIIALLALPVCAGAQQWESVRRDNNAMLSVDAQSVKRNGDQVTLDYMIDFRAPSNESPYRSIVVNVRVDCKARTILPLHADAYMKFGAQGEIVAKTAPSGPLVPQPVEQGSSDEDVWRHICLESKAPLKKKK
jgi:hypothetical protein